MRGVLAARISGKSFFFLKLLPVGCFAQKFRVLRTKVQGWALRGASWIYGFTGKQALQKSRLNPINIYMGGGVPKLESTLFIGFFLRRGSYNTWGV